MIVETFTLRQPHIDWLLQSGVPASAVVSPEPINYSRGTRARDGIFEYDPAGPEWFAIAEESDTIFWRPRTGEIATEWGAAFALGQDDIINPGVTALGGWLHVHADPLDWLRNRRRGIVVLRWEWAFEQLRDVARIAVAEDVLHTYRAHMRPKLPELGVIPREKARAA
jgi:hypothetical protein